MTRQSSPLVRKACQCIRMVGMPMIDGIYLTLSALRGLSESLAVASNNVANMGTDGFKKSRAILEEGVNGGIEVSIRKIETPGSPSSYEEGSTEVQRKETSNVDLAEESIRMIASQRGFESNLVALKVQNELRGTALDIIE